MSLELISTTHESMFHVIKKREWDTNGNEWAMILMRIDYWCRENALPIELKKGKTKIFPHEPGKYKNKICKDCIRAYRVSLKKK